MDDESLTPSATAVTAVDDSSTTTTDAESSAPKIFSEYNPFFNSGFFYFPDQHSSPSASSFDEDDRDANLIATKQRVNYGGSVLEYQQLYNRYSVCLEDLEEAIKEVESLRQENDLLRLTNADLARRVSLLLHAANRNCLLTDFNRLNINVSPYSTVTACRLPINTNHSERRNSEPVSLPRSISVRSKGYLNLIRPTRNSACNRDPSQSVPSSRVVVEGGKRQEEALEFEVYPQGMFKTELCNKWQESGTCPYGDDCQFAHGIKELRPVIRHPRYKTEVCRMILAGVTCPYGHRCHFRHSLTEQERIMAAPVPR